MSRTNHWLFTLMTATQWIQRSWVVLWQVLSEVRCL